MKSNKKSSKAVEIKKPVEMEPITVDSLTATPEDVANMVNVIVERASEGKKTYLSTAGSEYDRSHGVISSVGSDLGAVFKDIEKRLKFEGSLTISAQPPSKPVKVIEENKDGDEIWTQL